MKPAAEVAVVPSRINCLHLRYALTSSNARPSSGKAFGSKVHTERWGVFETESSFYSTGKGEFCSERLVSVCECEPVDSFDEERARRSEA